MLIKGDLIRIPAGTCVIKNDPSHLSVIHKYKFTEQPELAIFISYEGGEDAKVFLNNDYWIVNHKQINYVRKNVS